MSSSFKESDYATMFDSLERIQMSGGSNSKTRPKNISLPADNSKQSADSLRVAGGCRVFG